MKKNLHNIMNKGFTLAELIIVVAIIAVISTLALFNSAKLNSSVLLSDTAYEISLIIRDAQVSGLGAKVLATGGVATTSNQGIYIDPFAPTKIIFFSDLNNDNKYNVSEESQIYNIENKRAGQILGVCKLDAGVTTCTSSTFLDLNIIFKRPNPEAYFYYTQGGVSAEYFGSVVINIGFPGGECKSIIVYKTGAIQIDKSYCPPPTS